MKILILAGLIVSLLHLSCTSIFQSTPTDGIYLIPDGYVGPVIILFEQTDGIVPDVEGDYYIYKIPADGVLKVRTSAPLGMVNLKYFYLTKENQRNEIKYLEITGDRNPQGQPQNKYGNISDEEIKNKIFIMNRGGLGSFKTKKETIQFTSFIIGKPIDSEKLSDDLYNKIADIHGIYVEKDGN